MPQHIIKDNRLGVWRARLSSSRAVFIAIKRARHFLPSTAHRVSLLRFAVDATTAEQEVALCKLRSVEVSGGGLEHNLAMLTEKACVELFRFTHDNLQQVVALMGWPAEKRRTAYNGYETTATLASCVVLAILARPGRLQDMELLFGMFAPQLENIFREALHHFIAERGSLLTTPIPKSFFTNKAQRYAESVYEKCMTLDKVTSFIDGTVIGIARPGGVDSNQRTTYNGHKRKHAQKFQAITTPNGVCSHLFGPEVGRRHDMFLYASSNVEEFLNDALCVYQWNSICSICRRWFALKPFLEVPFSGNKMTPWQIAFNMAMSKVCMSVEWYFKEVKLYWGFTDFKRRLRVRQMPVELIYQAAVILTNFHNCIEPNQILQYFKCVPPTLQECINQRI